MRQFIVVFCISMPILSVHAQSAKEIITQLQSIHQATSADSGAAISRRSMNIFLADKTGYAAGSRDLSFFTNYVTFNSSEGRCTVNHNFQQAATGNDAPIKKLLRVGVDMTLASSYTKSFLDKRFESELGFTLNYKWLGRVKTRFSDGADQKQAMDALRSLTLETIATEMLQKENSFIAAMLKLDSIGATAKKMVTENFYADLKQLYEEKFAAEQAALLTKTMNFRLIRTHWTSLTAYIPLFFPAYKVAASLAAPFSSKHPYPLELILGHTRLWESAKKGRLFLTIEGTLLLNNSKLGYGLSKMNFSEYKSLGGTAPATAVGNNKLYIGAYQNFATPGVSGRLLYFPGTSHAGVSAAVEKSFGVFDFLNCRLGIPIVLINNKKTPAVNIECYVLFLDLLNSSTGISNTTAGLSIGIPFSRQMY
jgi:hypothetical protein